jgi:hypothetical protein
MHFSRHDEQPPLELPRSGPGALALAACLDALQEVASVGADASRLPRPPGACERQERRPQAAVDECDFSVDQRDRNDVGGASEASGRREYLMRFGVTPPRTANRLAGDDRCDAWKSIVGDEEQAALVQNVSWIDVPSP